MLVCPVKTIAESPAPYSGRDRQSSIPEHLLARLWQRRATRQQGFRTDRGLRVQVLYPGRPGKAAGPDFRDALLELEGVGLVQGDVEIHRRQQDWNAHGHHDDPNYNGVVLHAALETDDGSDTRVPSGQPISVISLAPLLEEEASGQATPSTDLWGLLARRGYPRPGSAEGMGLLLDQAGDARFRGKSSRFQRFLGEQAPEQTLYEAIFEALGYRNNQQPFLALASRTPYQALKQAARQLPPETRLKALESWLLEQAGLLPEDADRIALPRTGFGRPLSGREWHCFRVRPSNHPRRRIAGAARLLARSLDTGLVEGLRAATATDRPKDLARALTVSGDRDAGPAYIGAARAGDLAVNVVLSFLHALATLEGNASETRRHLGLYQCWGKLQENELTGEMGRLLIDPSWGKVVTTARRQQGLLHLQRLLAGGTG